MADYTYSFDPTGQQTSNLITGERHTLVYPAWKDFHFIVPKFAPFFAGSFEIKNLTQGKQLVNGKDFAFAHRFEQASLTTGRDIYGTILFYDKMLSDVVELKYQTLGGKWTLDETVIAEIMAEKASNPRVTTWETAAKVPENFPVIDHDFHIQDMVGQSEVVAALNAIAEAVEYRNGIVYTKAEIDSKFENAGFYNVNGIQNIEAGGQRTQEVVVDYNKATTFIIKAIGDFSLSHINWPTQQSANLEIVAVDWDKHNVTLPASWDFGEVNDFGFRSKVRLVLRTDDGGQTVDVMPAWLSS